MSATTAAFAAEARVRWIVAPPYPVTVDIAFLYRVLHPSYDGTVQGTGQRVNLNFQANSFTFPLVRVNYPF